MYTLIPVRFSALTGCLYVVYKYSKYPKICSPNLCVYWLTMLIFCFTVSMIWYRNIQRRGTCTPVLLIPAFIKSVAWLYVSMYALVYIDTYMHAHIRIFNGDEFYEHCMILFTIYHLQNITSERIYNTMRSYFMMNFKCTVSHFTVLPCKLILPEMCPMYHYYHMLCQQWRNKDVQSINQN